MKHLPTTKIVALKLCLVIPALALAACGGKVNTPSEGTPSDTGVVADGAIGGPDAIVPLDGGSFPETGVTTPDGSPPVDGGGVLPSDKTCERLADAMCGDGTKNCCTKLGFKYTPGGCRDAANAYCGQLVDSVAAGVSTYDESFLEGCAKGWTSSLTTCQIDFISYIKSTFDCSALFNGTKPVGAACSDPSECKAPKGGTAYCDESSKKCRSYAVVPAGASCTFYGAAVRYCDSGYYCDLAAETPICKPQKALGADCDGPDDFACGYDNVCKDGKCAKGLPGGSPCSSGGECASWTCDKDGKCTDSRYDMASVYLCGG